MKKSNKIKRSLGLGIILCLLMIYSSNSYSQGIGINEDGSLPDTRVILDIKSNNKGILLPRLSDTERNGLLQNVPEGVIIYNTTSHQLQIFYNNAWYPVNMGNAIPAQCEPETPGVITGNICVLENSDNEVYSISPVPYATNYFWTVPTEAIIIDGQGSTQIIVNFGTQDGNISVRAENSCGNSSYIDLPINVGCGGTILDGDNNTYTSILIGSQEWLTENLKTTKYNDGSQIPLVESGWQSTYSPAYCWYSNNYSTYGTVYGAMYNWYVTDPGSNGNKNVCPEGWHVPDYDDWITLVNYLDGESLSGGKMKEIGTLHWNDPNAGATNLSGFTGLPSGIRDANNGSFNYIGQFGVYWSSSQATTNTAYNSKLNYTDTYCNIQAWYKHFGLAIRCVKD